MTLVPLRFPLLCILGLFISSTASHATPQAVLSVTSEAGESFAPTVERYRTDREALRSFYDMEGSLLRRERLDRFDEQWLERLAATDFEALSVAGRIDYLLLRTEIEYQGERREIERERLATTAELMPFNPAIFALEEARWSLDPLDAAACAEVLTGIARQAKSVQEGVRLVSEEAEAEADGEPLLEVEAVEARRVARQVSQASDHLRTWYDHYAQYDPGFTWWNKEPFEAAREALKELSNHLREDIAGLKGEDDDPLIGDPIGRAGLLLDLQHEWLAYSPEELIAIGEHELAWCDEQLLVASNELGHGSDWRAALEEVKKLHVAPGEQDELVASQAREVIEFLKERDLVTIPPLCEETWRVQMLSKSGQRTLPFAAYGGQKMLVAFPTADMDLESKRMSMRGNNVHFTRAVTPHELIPGHHLQGFMAQRYATHRRIFRTPFLIEGWALYWEMVEWDEGWARSPEDRIGMLFWRKHRAARIIVSLRFHLGKMTPDEMIQFLVERVGHEEDSATSEVRRYIGGAYSPLYQCGYMIGGLQLRALYHEVVGELMNRKEFHDAILLENSIPIELIRASLMNLELQRDSRPSWKPGLGS